MAKKGDKIIVNFVLDETGSMSVCLNTTISGFNEYIASLKSRKEKISFTLTKFNADAVNVVYVDKPIEDVPDLNAETYKPNHLTPLYDAIGRSINEVETKIKDKKDLSVLFVILTDGEENASREYTQEAIFNLIKEKEAKGWAFAYLGANQDAWAVGSKMGFSKGNTMSFDTKDMRKTMAKVGGASACFFAMDHKARAQCKSFFAK